MRNLTLSKFKERRISICEIKKFYSYEILIFGKKRRGNFSWILFFIHSVNVEKMRSRPKLPVLHVSWTQLFCLLLASS